MHRRLFVLFATSIVATVVLVSASFWLLAPRASSFSENVGRVQRYVGGRFAAVWDDEAARSSLAEEAARELEVRIVLEDARGSELSRHGPSCAGRDYLTPVMRGGETLGTVRVCVPPRHGHGAAGILLLLFLTTACLWVFTGLIARRLVRPLDHLVGLARAYGEGDLAKRSNMSTEHDGEFGVLGETLDEMAARVQRQLDEQRELLAVVSHEIRSPLARLRVHLGMLEEQGVAPDAVAKMTREAVEMDQLVGDLLASARLDFSATEPRQLDLVALLEECLGRQGLDKQLLETSVRELELSGDPTLLARAVDNLLENAQVHAGGVQKVVLQCGAETCEVAVHDGGPGLPEEFAKVAFDSFVRGQRGHGSSLGLGLSLVRRVAAAHGGVCWAKARPEGGAEVGFSLSRQGRPEPSEN
ncbi:MAG: HAMP domain-containing sensor histidine kinase [Polyangiaceae bacterium]